MTDNERIINLLEDIKKSIDENNVRQVVDEQFSETTKLIEKAERRVEYSLNQIQVTFDSIHEKVFNFNNILIAAYFVLGTFPSNAPIIKLWTVIFPIINLVYLIAIEIRQMEIHRFASKEMEWTSKERDEYGRKIENQTLLSMIALALSIGCLSYLILMIFK